jgi:hypothetical protein
MKKISILKCLAIASIFLSASFGFAQVVAVPAGCRVVVAGTGGIVGPNPTGRVGDGGVVIMPDPSGGGAFNFTVGGVATAGTWKLSGDLSNSTTTPNNYGAPTQLATGSSANIISYNKNYRIPSESINPVWGRSKGQVKINYSLAGCGLSITVMS